jgi:hypothetical protein
MRFIYGEESGALHHRGVFMMCSLTAKHWEWKL